ncbi:MAG: peptide chain release factor 3 [Zavarzinella sp.]
MLNEILRRRTFAIISHPDAGKTTLTEKCLLYSGQIAEAGAVRGRKTTRAVTSDWMELEKERGISINSTALTFEYRKCLLNLLDTPGHQDFSEDTYRTLAAADSAVMVLDSANGVETQTRKLFKVCAARKIPVITFINKMDRLGKTPLDLLQEIQKELGITPIPLNWPIGLGDEFTGVYDRVTSNVLLFSPTVGGSLQVPTRVVPLDKVADFLPADLASRIVEEVELLEIAGEQFLQEKFLVGEHTPVFFGSAANNYGIEPFLNAFIDLAPTPGPRPGKNGLVPIDRPEFAGQVFKIQANLNLRHRDRVAFVRVCAGQFDSEQDLTVARTEERLRTKGSHRLFAQDREEVQSAYAGDVIGISFTKGVRLGDTLYCGEKVEFVGLPQFSPECFASVRCQDNARRKQLAEGLQQLADEGAVQLFRAPDNPQELILAAVGVLQFEVVKYRLSTEYGVQAEIVALEYKAGGWIGAPKSTLANVRLLPSTKIVYDIQNRPVILATDPFTIRYMRNKEASLKISPFSDHLFAPTD